MPEQMTQKEYWSGKVGNEWATRARGIDVMLETMTQAALDCAAFAPGDVVLDIGCGAGGTTMEIARSVAPGGSIVGVDLSPQLLTVARERGRDALAPIEFLEADAGATEFGKRFDVAFSRFGVMFFDDPPRAFAHIRAQMRPHGRMVFVCWRSHLENAFATTPVQAIAAMLRAPLPAPDPDAPGPFAFADRAKVERILASAGWSGVDFQAWDGPMLIAGGGSPAETAEFLLHIGPLARAIADQGLRVEDAKQMLVEQLGPRHDKDGLRLTAACWIVSARA